jgi:hypothetical protein
MILGNGVGNSNFTKRLRQRGSVLECASPLALSYLR